MERDLNTCNSLENDGTEASNSDLSSVASQSVAAIATEVTPIEYNPCPEFPFFGASYPDATCINGQLYDLDKCDENGNLYEMGEYWPCPFCQTEAFIKQFAEYSGRKYKDVRTLVKELKAKHGYKKPTNEPNDNRSVATDEAIKDQSSQPKEKWIKPDITFNTGRSIS